MADADTMDDGLGLLTPSDGPWSADAAPEDAPLLDFGPLKLPALPGIKLRLEIDPDRNEIGAATVRIADCALQLQVIAAARGVGEWTDTRQELLANLKRRPGHQQVIEGKFGAEVIGVITGRTPEGIPLDATMRFQGIEGDRWMIRAVSSGPSVTQDGTVSRVNAFLSRCAVDIGDGTAPAGTVLPLTDPPGGIDLDHLEDRE